jgi:hypothetical protein
MQKNCTKHWEWQGQTGATLGRIERNQVKIAAKLNVEISEGE